MKPADFAIIAALVLLVGAVVAYLVKNRKKGGCASCPYANSCPNRKPAGCQGCQNPCENENKMDKENNS